jgi:hypothetical protein
MAYLIIRNLGIRFVLQCLSGKRVKQNRRIGFNCIQNVTKK